MEIRRNPETYSLSKKIMEAARFRHRGGASSKRGVMMEVRVSYSGGRNYRTGSSTEPLQDPLRL